MGATNSEHYLIPSMQDMPSSQNQVPWRRFSPLWIALIGVSVSVVDLITKGSFDPFAIVTFFVMACFEFLFRRQQRFPSIALSLVATIAFILAFRAYGIDLKIMRTNGFAPRIPRDARMVIQKSFWRLTPGDLVIFQRDADPRNYVGVVKDGPRDSTYELIASNGKVEHITRRWLKGKIILVLPTNGI